MNIKWTRISIVTATCYIATMPLARGGEILSEFGDVVTVASLALNNDDYSGELKNNPNLLRANGRRDAPRDQQSISGFELFFSVSDSAGTTEYTFDLGGRYSGSENEPLTLDNRFVLELGFGSGDSFVRASDTNVPIFFDVGPTPVVGTLPDFSGPVVESFEFLDLVESSSDRLLFQGNSRGTYSFSFPDEMLTISADVPDIPLNVWDHYDLNSLPVALSPDASLFTLRGFLSPGPDTSGDFNQDGKLDEADIDLLTENLRIGSNDSKFDLDASGGLDEADRRILINELMNTYYGDANLDGEFDSVDIVAVFQYGIYEDDISMNAMWRSGDWNGDGEFSSDDLVTAFIEGGWLQGRRRAVNAVPEPASLLVPFMGWAAVFACRRKARSAASNRSHSRRSSVGT